MPALHQNPDNMAVAGKIKEVLEQRIGSDRFGLWFGQRVSFCFDGQRLVVIVDGEFARERLRRNYFRAIESAAAETLQRLVEVSLVLPSEQDAMLALAGTDPEATPDASANAQAEVIAAANEGDIGAGEDIRVNRSVQPIGRGGQRSPYGDARLEPRRLADSGSDILPADDSPADGSLGGHLPAESGLSRQEQGERPMKSTSSLAGGPRPSRHGVRPAAADGPQPLSQLALRSATEPRHSQRISSNSLSGTTPSMQPASDRTDFAGQPQAGGATDRKPLRRTPPSPAHAPAHSTARRNDALTFANFVCGTSNTLAQTAATLLANEPVGAAPLCFWGATGTGKTHLLSAIRHELRSRHRLGRVLLMSAEEFTNDFLSCVRGTGLPAFRKRYRDVDALLIDNVQFLGGKNATVREMLYTIDTILQRHRPLVMAADRPPLEIPGLSADLAGRMSSGLVCGINPLDLELRRSLLRIQAQHSYLPWDEETIELIAQRIPGDGRAVQGIVQMVSMLQRMYRRMPTLDEIAAHAGESLQSGPKAVALADVEKAICTAFGLTSAELRSNSKARNISDPRILAMYLSRQHTTAAFAEIGRYYGDRNHSTVIAAHRRAEDWIKSGKAVGGRGRKNLLVQDAIAAVENLLRIG